MLIKHHKTINKPYLQGYELTVAYSPLAGDFHKIIVFIRLLGESFFIVSNASVYNV